MKKLSCILSTVLLLSLATSAFGQTGMAQAPESRMAAGLRLMVLPWGQYGIGAKDPIDLQFAFGFSPYFDYNVIPKYLAIGLGPEFIFNVGEKGKSGDPGKEININLRIKGQYPIFPSLNAYLLLTPGYSLTFFPGFDDNSNPKGFLLGFAGGAEYKFTPLIGAFMELGYEMGFQSIPQVDTKISYLMWNLGAAFHF